MALITGSSGSAVGRYYATLVFTAKRGRQEKLTLEALRLAEQSGCRAQCCGKGNAGRVLPSLWGARLH